MKTKYAILTVRSFLMLAGASKVWAVDGPLTLRCESPALAIHNGVTSQAIETTYGTNLLGLSFTGTTTYDFYSTPFMAAVSLPTSYQGKGIICMQNTSPTSANDFQVTGQMRYYDYNPVTGMDTLIVDTGASAAENVPHGQTANWDMNSVHVPANYTMPAGDLLHVAVTVTVVSGNPGAGAQVLYNGPKGSTTIADMTYPACGNFGGPLVWPVTSGPVAPPTMLSLSVSGDPAAQISCSGTPGATYLIQATTNLGNPSSWVTIGTNVAGANGLFTYMDSDATNYPSRFYRATTQ
jgi:hypothetical protein